MTPTHRNALLVTTSLLSRVVGVDEPEPRPQRVQFHRRTVIHAGSAEEFAEIQTAVQQQIQRTKDQ